MQKKNPQSYLNNQRKSPAEFKSIYSKIYAKYFKFCNQFQFLLFIVSFPLKKKISEIQIN